MDHSPLRFPNIKGYRIGVEIGGGGFSKVFRAVDDNTNQLAACKVVNIFVNPNSVHSAPNVKELQKEVQVHKALKHHYVLEYLHHELVAKEKEREGLVPGLYILLELAVGGDLFDKIAPDVGVPEDLAKFYFAQMCSGMEFIHSKGIAHRDLKPENLLLAANGNLKITDFGLCAVFRHQGKTRLLSGRVGSLPYVAPEINGLPGTGYAAEPVDIWGMGVVLYTLLVGNTPWDEPGDNSPEFCAYRTGELLNYDPWTRIRGQARAILLSMLHIDPQQRITIEGIKQHPWCMTPSQLHREQIPEALTQGLRGAGMMTYADPTFNSGASQAYTSQRNQRMASQTGFFNKEESQFMRGTGNITQAGDLMSITTRFWLSLSPPNALQLLSSYLTSSLGAKNVRLTLSKDPSTGRVAEDGSAGGNITVVKLAGNNRMEGTFIVRGNDSLAAEGQSLVVMRRGKGSLLHWRSFWWSVVRAQELEQYIVRGDE
ncbi:hypothetical protein L202_04708 [Cryptococcus amylolentus CBS 6039]|uniref:non-specific serine/threonine protein kinase n=2 Tax=Cryptococcus amylolentus TaxID=104669 RepID=A0A1E3HN08_9TREE|nr:hypothetical protein L202_04708 [Cryptococcus amylolentus CBS 6039]ODN77535.1 hypothetical protein L202_04708 [Cryptococcus amylolentus CBS 6039]ODO05578.1 hypothetical protein I350_04634 [Cryptococcus amylolentus CBS 6273]